MKPYTIKYNTNLNKFTLSDGSRKLIKFKSNEHELNEIVNFIKRTDVSFRIVFIDNNNEEQKLKVRFGHSAYWLIVHERPLKFTTKDLFFGNKLTDKRMTLEFPLMNGKNIYLWWEKGLVMYGKTRMDAVPINRENLKIIVSYI